MNKHNTSSVMVLFLALGFGHTGLFGSFFNNLGGQKPVQQLAPIFQPLNLNRELERFQENLDVMPKNLTPRYLWRTFKNSA